MTQFSITTTTTTTTTTTITATISSTTHHFYSLLLSYILLFFSFIFSHPLYFSYFIFFSPYLLKLLSFLSPLFITTSLFLLAFLTIHHHPYSHNSESKVGFLLTSYQKVLNTLSWSVDDGNSHNFHLLEELEACMVVLENDLQSYVFTDPCKEVALTIEDKAEEFSQSKVEEVVTVQELSHSQLPELTSKSHVEESTLTKEPPIKHKEQQTKPPSTIDKEHKKSPEMLCSTTLSQYGSMRKENQTSEMLSSTTLTPCGSMRKEKEWKRTLACKLYEERQNTAGSEGMDSLWEEDEADTKVMKRNSKSKVKKETEFGENEEEEEEDDDQMDDVKLCCLQALKFSTGKMHLGMRKPSLVKISKALKGIGWLHHMSSAKKRVE